MVEAKQTVFFLLALFLASLIVRIISSSNQKKLEQARKNKAQRENSSFLSMQTQRELLNAVSLILGKMLEEKHDKEIEKMKEIVDGLEKEVSIDLMERATRASKW